MKATITGDLSKYIDTNGFLNLLVQTKENAGSCPMLFTYDGGRYVFAGDLYNRGILAVPKFNPVPEDYAKIESHQLQPNDGLYKLQIAQDYDEISYLDQLALMTVDHSPDVNVYPSLLLKDAGKVFTVRKNLLSPVTASDKDGKDVLPKIISKDGQYTDGRQYELNILDLNLGGLSAANQIKLVISAYTSWDNNKIPKTEGASSPVGRFLQVKDNTGKWVTIYDWTLQTPAAIPETYVVDLTGKFLTNDYSVRIGYYPDVRFDYVGIDTSPQQEVTVNRLPPVYADLHFRGYSNIEGKPAIHDYYDLSTNPPSGYSTPTGKFTKFGDVIPLLLDKDDRFVVMHHGDEISANFQYIPAEEGKERDFMLYTWGYYKGSSFVTGGTVDPLPFNGMSSYPYPNSESYPSDADHMNYLNEYNTRYYEANPNTMSQEHHSVYTDYMMVSITHSARAVGGLTMSVNKAALLAPYLALAGLIVAVSTVVVVKRKRD